MRNIIRLALEGDENRIETRLYQKSKELRKVLREQNRDEIAGDVILDKIEEIITILQKVYRKEVK